MSTAASRIDSLLEFDAEGRKALDRPRNTDRVSTLDSEKGPIVLVEGRRLHSSRDPIREATRWARNLDLAEATVVVVLGFGSGYHVRAIERRSTARIVVFEPDVEVLSEGLEHGTLGDRVVVFTDPKRLGLYLAASLRGTDRGVIAPWAASARNGAPAYAEALQSAKDAIGRAKLRHRTACLRGRGWLGHYTTNLRRLADTPTLPQLENSMRGCPAIIVAAGPSLDLNVDQLTDLSQDALVLTVNTAAKALDARGVRPHALVSIESADVSAGLRDLPWLTELPAFLELTGSPKIWELPFHKTVAVSVDTNACAIFSNRLSPGLGISAGFCVANAAVSIAQRLGCSPIILVGSDLAYAAGRVYASGTMFEEMRAESDGTDKVSFSGMDSRREIEDASADALGGNHMPSVAHTVEVLGHDQTSNVVTTRDFVMFRDWYSHFAQQHPDVPLINATEGGAYIEGWEHMSLAAAAARYEIGGNVTGVAEKFAQALSTPACDARVLRPVVEAELQRASTVLALSGRALEIIRHDPDGDLTLDPETADALHAINAQVRAELREAPLLSEAAFPSIEELRARGDISTYSFYASLIDPIEALANDLAQLLQTTEWKPGLA